MLTAPRETVDADSSTVPSHLARDLFLFLIISILLLVPCFWHRHIEAGDLGSHVYNAWLAELIEQGKAPGLYTVTQWDNVLFDLVLLSFGKLFGLLLAEKLATSLCVLVFFWGLFALMKTVSLQSPWFLTPCIAMLTYGYIFHMGFFNYYLSLGLGCIGLSLIWPGRKNGLLAGLLLAPVVLLAHPLGFFFVIGTGVYRLLWLKWTGWSKWLLPVLAVGVCLAARWYVSYSASRHGYDVEWREAPLWRMTGVDQFHVFGERYVHVMLSVAVLVLLATAVAALRSTQRAQFWSGRRLLLELYFVSFCGTALLPENIQTQPNAGWIGALATRLTLVTAIFGFCWLAVLPPRRWHLVACGAVAAVFFAFIYQDTGFLNRMEANTEKLTRQLPFGTRAMSTIFAPNDYRTIYLHIPDRACIGHCLLVSNYEPSAKQFRIRVREGSPVATASQDDSEDMQSGSYDVQEEDLPLKQIYQCDARDLTRICIRDLAEDEKNGRLGYHPVTNPFFSQNP
jgi:hypothetical protein